jgi:uncharacterized protein
MNLSAKIDVFQFCQGERARDGSLAVSGLSRLADLLASTQGDVAWSVEGRTRARTGAQPDCLLSLRISTRLHRPCSRCLQALEVTVDSTRDFLVVRSEREAEQRDDPESETDVLVGDSRFDLTEWIEDELILALPPVQFHERCDGLAVQQSGATPPAGDPFDEATERRRPFEALLRMKRPGVE